jgi:predicted  nucleic acid-binding Zn-ribbon protein
MENEQLKSENVDLKAQLHGLSFNLLQADKMIANLQRELEALQKQVKDLTNQLRYSNVKLNNEIDKKDSRYY